MINKGKARGKTKTKRKKHSKREPTIFDLAGSGAGKATVEEAKEDA